jgi:hypothetical protein
VTGPAKKAMLTIKESCTGENEKDWMKKDKIK